MDKKHNEKEVVEQYNHEEENCEEVLLVDENALKIEELQNKLHEADDRFLRANADFENIKKRLEREKYQAIDYSNEQFARDLLSIVDALEIAYKSGQNEEAGEFTKKIVEGVGLTLEQFKKVFEKNSIKVVDISGKFNPEVHDAILQVQSDNHESGDIVQELQKGYKIKDRVLRPSMVSIAK